MRILKEAQAAIAGFTLAASIGGAGYGIVKLSEAAERENTLTTAILSETAKISAAADLLTDNPTGKTIEKSGDAGGHYVIYKPPRRPQPEESGKLIRQVRDELRAMGDNQIVYGQLNDIAESLPTVNAESYHGQPVNDSTFKPQRDSLHIAQDHVWTYSQLGQERDTAEREGIKGAMGALVSSIAGFISFTAIRDSMRRNK